MAPTLTKDKDAPPERRKSRHERRFGFTRRFGERRRKSESVKHERRKGERRGNTKTRRSGADRRGFLGLRRAIDAL